MNIAVLLFHELSELELTAPYSVLREARAQRLAENPEPDDPLEVYTVAKSRNSVETAGGLIITPHWAFVSAPPPDVLIVPGGRGVMAARRDKALLAYLGEHAPRLRLLVGIASGVLLLGELGLLRDLRATTHPLRVGSLRDYEVGEIVDAPLVKNENGLWFVRDAAAGLTLGTELVRELFTPQLAAAVAARLGVAE